MSLRVFHDLSVHSQVLEFMIDLEQEKELELEMSPAQMLKESVCGTKTRPGEAPAAAAGKCQTGSRGFQALYFLRVPEFATECTSG